MLFVHVCLWWDCKSYHTSYHTQWNHNECELKIRVSMDTVYLLYVRYTCTKLWYILNITSRCKKYWHKTTEEANLWCIQLYQGHIRTLWIRKVAILGAGMGGSALALWLRSSQQFRLWAFISQLKSYCLPGWFCNQWLQLDLTSWLTRRLRWDVGPRKCSIEHWGGCSCRLSFQFTRRF